jgi:hypothetical protein
MKVRHRIGEHGSLLDDHRTADVSSKEWDERRGTSELLGRKVHHAFGAEQFHHARALIASRTPRTIPMGWPMVAQQEGNSVFGPGIS